MSSIIAYVFILRATAACQKFSKAIANIIPVKFCTTGIEYFHAQLYHQRMVSAVEAVSTRLAPGGDHIGSAGGGPGSAGVQHVHLRHTIHARASPRQ